MMSDQGRARKLSRDNPNWATMRKTPTAVELIKQFQRLFSHLNHKQIAERLVKLVMQERSISRVAFIVRRDRRLYLVSLGRTDKEQNLHIDVLNSPLSKHPRFPHEQIEQTFSQKRPLELGQNAIDELGHNTLSRGTRSAYLQPLVEKDETLAVFYMESREDLQRLKHSVNALDNIWVFSSLVAHQLLTRWEQEELADQQRLAEQALWANEAYLHAILHHSPALISVKDLEGNVILASEHHKHLEHVGEDGYLGKNVFDVYPKEIAQTLWDVDLAARDTQQPVEAELDLMHKDGSLHTYLMVKFPLRQPDGEIFGVCSICTDISERKLAETALREQQSRYNYMAFHDSLTALPNRSLFYDRIYHSLARSQRSGCKLALMLLDIDRFKVINDSLGHDSGDLLLKTIAARLHEGVRDMDTVARLGGDEFVVVLEGVHDLEDVKFIANKLLVTLARPLQISGHDISTTVSIGISLFPDDGQDTEELLKNADIAMYKAKEAGKNNCQFYTKGMSASAVNYLLLENDLRRALEQDQFILHYQPQVDLQTGSLVGVEALVRWQHPDRGLVSPAHFIPLAEETGLIAPLGDWVLRKACYQQKRWLDSGKRVGRMAVNLSPRQFRQRNFPEKVAKLLSETGLPAHYLELEITESCAMEHAGETITHLNQLHQMGLFLAIDDFGTGYSSLSYLKRFPIQKLKIDSSFIHDIETDPNDTAIAKSIIGLAHNMQLEVVAEGVEKAAQSDWLRAEGCDQGQGFLFSKPLTAQQFESRFRGKDFAFDGHVVPINALNG